MKKILVSTPFVILVALDILFIVGYSEKIFGALGILQFSYIDPTVELLGLFCFPIGPSLLATYFYAKVVTKNQVNVSALGSWTLLIFGIFLTLIYLPDPLMESFSPEQFYLGRRLLAIVFTCLGVIGLISLRIRKTSMPKEQDNAIHKEDLP